MTFSMTDHSNNRHPGEEPQLDSEASELRIVERVARLGTWKLDLRSGCLTWSEATCNLFGVIPSEFAGALDNFYSLILAEDVAGYDNVLARISPSESFFEAEYRIRRPDGEVRRMHERGKGKFDAYGIPTGRAGVVMDITDQQAERELRMQSGELLAQIAGRVARLGGWTIDLPERTLTWSDENCAIHDVPPGYQPTLEEGIGYFPPECQAQVVAYVDACARDGVPYDFELPKFTAKGRLIWVRSIGEAVRDDEGKIIRLQGAFQDITRRRQVEEEKEKLIKELRAALAEVKTLREFLPICSYCKKVRDDQNYWTQIESYISNHTSTKFSHGICPECYEINIAPELEEKSRRNVDAKNIDLRARLDES